MRTRIVLVLVAVSLAACDNFSEFGNPPPPDVITVEGAWEGTASTSACTPAEGTSSDICQALLELGEFPFQLFLNQQDDRVAGTLHYAGLVAVVGGVVTEEDIIRLAGSALGILAGAQVTVIVRGWSTDILGRGIAGSRMSGAWRTEIAIQGSDTVVTVGEHTIVLASRTR